MWSGLGEGQALLTEGAVVLESSGDFAEGQVAEVVEERLLRELEVLLGGHEPAQPWSESRLYLRVVVTVLSFDMIIGAGVVVAEAPGSSSDRSLQS